MPPKKRGAKANGVSDRPRDQPSLLVAFAKQIRLQRCTVCSCEIAAGVFAAHQRDCRVRSDDEECQVLFTQTAEEKWAAGLITLDEYEESQENKEMAVTVKRETETPTTSRGRRPSTQQQRRAAKRRIEGGDSAEDDSDFAPNSQESAEAEQTVRKRDEPVRTRRSARVNLPVGESSQAETAAAPAVAADAADELMDAATGGEEEENEVEEESEENGDDLNATIYEEEDEEGGEGEVDEVMEVDAARAASDATAPTSSRRLTRAAAAAEAATSSQDNQVFADYDRRPTPSPPDSATSSMEVEPIDLDATIAPPPPEDEARVSRRRKRKEQKDTVEGDAPPLEEKRVTRRSMKGASQDSQSSQDQAEAVRPGRAARKEEQRKKRAEADEAERRKEAQKEKEEEERKKREEELAATRASFVEIRKRQEKNAKRIEEEKRRDEEEKKEAEERDNQPVAGLTKILLRSLEDKCVRHEKGLVPSQELVQAAVIVLEEEDPQVVPHYVYLVCLIMRRVLSARTSDGRVHDETFWGRELHLVERFLALKDDAKLLFIRLFTRKRGWHLPEKLREKYYYLKDRIDDALQELHKAGFLENAKALTSTEEALRLCSLDLLKALAKDFRVEANKPKPALIEALIASCMTQRLLFAGYTTPGNTSRLLIMAKKKLGGVYRTSPSAHSFFRAAFSLYSPTMSDSQLIAEDRTINLMSNMLFRMKDIHYETAVRIAPFPADGMIGIYEDKEDLFRYVEAKEAEERLLRALDRHDSKAAVEEAEKAREELVEMKSTRIAYLRTLPAHLLQYTTEAVLTRIVRYGVDCLEKEKKYAGACNWIRFIMRNQVLSSLIPHSIGGLFERLALDLHHHLDETEEAIDEIKKALDDPLVPDKHRLQLDDRAKRLLKDKWQSRFSLIPPTDITIEGETIGRDLGDGRKNQFVRKNKDGDVEHVSVETVALDHFLAQGMEGGLHSEGEVWHLSMRLLFADVIYAPHVDGVWMCELQSAPTDYDYSLYETRKEAFEERFQWLRTSSEADRLAMVDQHWNGTEKIPMEQIKSFLSACALPTLLGVLQILVKEPRNRRSGFPDLVLWSASKRMITVAEVKGPGDTLSTKQRLWLDFFAQQDKQRVQAYLCKVTASGRKRLQ